MLASWSGLCEILTTLRVVFFCFKKYYTVLICAQTYWRVKVAMETMHQHFSTPCFSLYHYLAFCVWALWNFHICSNVEAQRSRNLICWFMKTLLMQLIQNIYSFKEKAYRFQSESTDIIHGTALWVLLIIYFQELCLYFSSISNSTNQWCFAFWLALRRHNSAYFRSWILTSPLLLTKLSL